MNICNCDKNSRERGRRIEMEIMMIDSRLAHNRRSYDVFCSITNFYLVLFPDLDMDRLVKLNPLKL